MQGASSVYFGVGELSGFAVAAEHVYNLVLVKFFHFVASRAEVLAGVEFAGLGGEYFAYGSGHSQTAVRVDVDFANSALGSFAEFFFGDTDSVRKLATVFVDGVNVFLGH